MKIEEAEELIIRTSKRATQVADELKETYAFQKQIVDEQQTRKARSDILKIYESARDDLLGIIVNDILTNKDDSMGDLKKDLTELSNRMMDAKRDLQKAKNELERRRNKIPNSDIRMIDEKSNDGN